jgi:hypothetical protein
MPPFPVEILAALPCLSMCSSIPALISARGFACPVSALIAILLLLRNPAPGALSLAPHAVAAYVFTKFPNASTMNAMMATQNAYVLTYWMGVKVLTTASTAISTESINIHIDGA